MKKTTGICILTIFLLIVGFAACFAWQNGTAQEAYPAQEPSETVRASETETEELQEVLAQETGETTDAAFLIQVSDRRLVVCDAATKEILFETNILFETLDEAMRESVCNGIYLTDEKELFDFLEAYSS